MHEVLIGMLAWIGSHTGYVTTLELPNVVMTTQHNMCAVYGIDSKSRCDDSRLRGFYDKNVTIYMHVGFDTSDHHARSQLLHELVHYVQWANQSNAGKCLGHLELEAYDLQDKWRSQHELKPTLSEFNRLMLEASCDA